MKKNIIVAIILMSAGALTLGREQLNFKRMGQMADAGLIQIYEESSPADRLPSVAGGIWLMGGLLLLIVNTAKLGAF